MTRRAKIPHQPSYLWLEATMAHKTAKQQLESRKPRNALLAVILKSNPRRLQNRVITPKKNKKRPRRSNRAAKEMGDA
jgi:hypothetical protein